MRCKFCGCDPDLICVVPARKMFGRAIEVPACRSCAIVEGVYCTKHDIPHTGFDDDTTACIVCIMEDVAKARGDADSFHKQLLKGLPDRQWADLQEVAEMSADLMGDSDAMAILRFIVSKAHRLHITPEAVVEQVLRAGTAEMPLSRLI